MNELLFLALCYAIVLPAFLYTIYKPKVKTVKVLKTLEINGQQLTIN